MKERRRWWPWIIAFAYVAVVGTVLVLVARRLEDAGVEAIGLTLTVGTAAVTWAWRRVRHSEPTEATELGRAQRALAVMVRDQWDDEAAARGLVDPAPIPVRWRSAQEESGDYLRLVGGTVAGDCGDMPGFARAFRALPKRRLVVLGAPGSGKTTLVLLLVRELLARSEPDEQVPVLLCLSTWDPLREPLAVWIARRLREDYPGLSNHDSNGRTAAAELVAERRVLPVLDGLDELPPPQRAPALAALNRALAGGMSLILSCRTAEFNEVVDQEDVVTAAAVVVAEPVSVEDAVAFLADGVPPRRAAAWEEVFRTVREDPGGPLAQALKLPLNVWLVRTTYSSAHADPGDLIRFTDLRSIQEQLLDCLIPAVYTRGTNLAVEAGAPGSREAAAARWSAADARSWLGFLAGHLRDLGTDQLSWWQLPRGLPPDPVGPLSGPVFGAVVGLGAGADAAETFADWALPGMLQFLGFLMFTVGTALGVFAVIRSASGAVSRRTRHVAARYACAAIAILAVGAVGIAAVVDRAVRLMVPENPGWVVTPGVGTRAAVAWAAAVVVIGVAVGLIAGPLSRAHDRRVAPAHSRLTRLAAFALLFLLGAEVAAVLTNLPSMERPDAPGLMKDPAFGSHLADASKGALNTMLLFLMVAGTMLSLAPAGGLTAPGRLDFRLSGRVWALVDRLPGMLLRGLCLGVLFGAAIGFLYDPEQLPRHVVVEGITLFGAVVGVLCGVGAAVVQWARIPADTDHSTPASTLAGDRRLAVAAMVIATAPLVVKWVIATVGGFRGGPDAVLNSAAAPLETLESSLALGCAVGLLFVSRTAWFAFREAGLRLAADHSLTRALLAFLEDARLLCLLRCTGASYQFCHAALQEHLAARPESAPGADEVERSSAPSVR